MTNMKIPVLGRVLAVALITWARIWPFKVPHLVAAVQVQLQTVQHVKQIEWPMGMNKNSIDWSPIAQKQFPLLPSMSQGKWKWTMIHFCHVLLAIYRKWWVKPITLISPYNIEFKWVYLICKSETRSRIFPRNRRLWDTRNGNYKTIGRQKLAVLLTSSEWKCRTKWPGGWPRDHHANHAAAQNLKMGLRESSFSRRGKCPFIIQISSNI